MLMQQIAGGDEMAADAPDTLTTAPQEKEAEYTGNQYIQDLYRFFKLSPFGKEVPDIFSLPLNIFECNSLAGNLGSYLADAILGISLQAL